VESEDTQHEGDPEPPLHRAGMDRVDVVHLDRDAGRGGLSFAMIVTWAGGEIARLGRAVRPYVWHRPLSGHLRVPFLANPTRLRLRNGPVLYRCDLSAAANGASAMRESRQRCGWRDGSGPAVALSSSVRFADAPGRIKVASQGSSGATS
jgi:hypothetical protein